MIKKLLLINTFLFVFLGVYAQHSVNKAGKWIKGSPVYSDTFKDFDSRVNSSSFLEKNQKLDFEVLPNQNNRNINQTNVKLKNISRYFSQNDANVFNPNIQDFYPTERSENLPRVKFKSNSRTQTRVNDWSYYYVENNSRFVYELNDFFEKNNVLNPNTQTVLKFDSALFNGTTNKQGVSGNITWRKEFYQMIPLTGAATINKIGLKARSVKDTISKPAGQDSSKIMVTVFDKTFQSVLSTDSFYVKTAGTFLNVLCTFKKPVETSDTVYVNYSMATPADSFRFAMTFTRYNNTNFGTSAEPKVFTSPTIPFTPHSVILTIDANADTLLQNQGGFDFYSVPQISYDFKADFTAKSGVNSSSSSLSIKPGDTVNFFNNSAALNPLLNSDLYWRTIGSSQFDTAGIITSKYIFAAGDTLKTLENPVAKKYINGGTYNVNANTYTWPWLSNTFLKDSTYIEVKVLCDITLSASSFVLPNNAAASNVTVANITASNCLWNAIVDANSSWLTTSSNGTGNGSIVINVTENTSTTSRTATITVNGKTITITQPGASVVNCTYSLSPSSYTCADNTAKTYNAISSVTTGSTCSWTATSNDSWITTTSSGTGNGSVSITVTENNTGIQRSGTITVNGQTLTITQPAAPKVGTKIDDWSYYYIENNNRFVYELNDFFQKNNVLNTNTQTVLKFDSTLFNGTTNKQGVSGNITWRKEFYQMIPLTSAATINKIGLKARSIKDTISIPAGQDSSKIMVTAFDKTFKTVLSTDSFYVKTSGSFLNVLCTFKKPVASSDTVYINYSMATPADSFRFGMTFTRYNNTNFGTSAAPKVFTSPSVPYTPHSIILTIDVNADTLLQNQGGFDFYSVPQISYEYKADFTASKGANSSNTSLTVAPGDTVNFTNNTHATNPLINSDLYWRTIGSSQFDTAGIITSKYIFASGDTLKTLLNPVSKKYPVAGSFNVMAYSYLYPWVKDWVKDSTVINIKVECSVALSASSFSLPNNAAASNVTVANVTATSCPWTATVDANSSWLTTTSSGSGNGSLVINVTENTSSNPRTGTITVNGKTITITQPGANNNTCTYAVSPSTYTCADNTAKTYNNIANVTTGSTCAWTAVSNASWITTTSSGTGNGSVSITVTENTTGAQRSGTITINGQTLTINQPAANSGNCTYTLTPNAFNCPDNTAKTYNGISSVTTGSSCSWTAVSNAQWINTTSSGTGNGDVSITVLENATGSSRTGTVVVNGQTLTVTQPAGTAPTGCTYALSTSNYTCADNTAKTYTAISNVSVISGTNCSWNAVVKTGSNWLSTSSSGNGSGSITITVIENTTSFQRSGTIEVGGQTLTVTQPGKSNSGGTCSYSLSQATFTCKDGSSNSYPSIILVNTSSTCPWSATVTSGSNWLATNSNGVGAGTISIIVLQNNSTSPRQGTIDINGQTLTIIQPGATCTYSLSASNFSCSDPTARKYTGVVLVNALSGCSWTAVVNSGNSWLATSSSGNGSGSIDITVLANNTGATRTGTIKIEDQTLTITQESSGANGIKDNDVKSIAVYPNPATNYVVVDRGNLNINAGYSIKIANTLGQVVYTQELNKEQLIIDVTNWNGKGIYFIQFIDDRNNILETRKLILN